MELMFHTHHSWLFLGLCKDMEVAVSDLKIKNPFYVVVHKDHDLILGQLFFNTVRFCQDYKPDGVYGIITHL